MAANYRTMATKSESWMAGTLVYIPKLKECLPQHHLKECLLGITRKECRNQ
jgi:hypothetical protein